MPRFLFRVLVNSVLASRLVPPRARWRLMRLIGMDVAPCTILEGAYFSARDFVAERGAYAGIGLHVQCAAPVRLGADCALGPQVMLLTGSHELGPSDVRAGRSTFASIEVGAGAWLGARVTVLPGVRIGAGSVVAAGAVVTEDLAPDGLYAGVPARLVRELQV